MQDPHVQRVLTGGAGQRLEIVLSGHGDRSKGHTGHLHYRGSHNLLPSD